MKRFLPYCITIALMACASYQAYSQDEVAIINDLDELRSDSIPVDTLVLSDPVLLFESMPQPEVNYNITNLSLIPKVFSGYQKIQTIPALSERPLKYNLAVTTPIEEPLDSLEDLVQRELSDFGVVNPIIMDEVSEIPEENGLPSIQTYKTPKWLKDALLTTLSQENILYSYMIDNPMEIEYAYWDLPLPPVLLEEDRSFKAFLMKQDVPNVNVTDAVLPEVEIKKKHWLHKFGSQLQFSQAFISPNWYQGGNNYLSLLLGFNWNVQLNQVYHPKLLFQSDLSYKLAITSNPSGYYHKYTIAEDNLQYNLNAGLKAIKNWYYSFNLQFKTQILNNFEQNSSVRTASFLSPGDLNLGLGMSYNHKNKLNTLQYTLTISPLSYNLKTCISDKVNHETYNIAPDKKTKSEIGSNLELNLDWKITANISYKTKLFMFSDYHYFLTDWQNTVNFEINKFLSTQIFIHLRYDGSVESYGNWKKFMMKEILSFGLSYTFSTKP